ncbi:beta-lactamase-like protein [Dactylonectria estremocensis]|uniref:Beta-lactamase-like protein n=1 Tax=Dactylonectria estremocensis TaxID=1079267 RepID=A0A9P9EGI6_9HYPO|nr:beta-lactamase-like protein [Dactylonectria estremocensis]
MVRTTQIFAVFLALLNNIVLGNVVPQRAIEKDQDPEILLQRAIEALGGSDAISKVDTVMLQGPQVFRTKSIPEAISLDQIDTVVVTSGGQNITYNYYESFVRQRLDRKHTLGSLWIYGRADLRPMEYSFIVEDAHKPFAAVVEGSYNIFAPDAPPSGYLDGEIAGYLITDAYRWDPLLVNKILTHGNFSFYKEIVDEDYEYPAVYDKTLGLSVLLDPDTFLPYIIRSYEAHPFFGNSTYDLRVYDYSEHEGVLFPQVYKTIYNSHLIITDWRVDNVVVNPKLDDTFFSAPIVERTEYDTPVYNSFNTAEIGEKYTNYLWDGPFNSTVDELVATHWDDLPGVWALKLPELRFYRQLLLEFDDGVAIADCPPQQSRIIIEWAQKNLNKTVKYILPTHHHHDHAMGLPDYVKAGAKAVVPDIATNYYSKIEGIEFETYTRNKPHVMEGNGFRVVLIHMKQGIHAEDHIYALVMPTNVVENSTVIVFDADHVTRGDEILDNNDHTEMWELISSLWDYKVSENAQIVPVHGQEPIIQLSVLINATGFNYPSFSPLDFDITGNGR